MFKFTLAIATAVLLFTSSVNYSCASPSLEEENSSRPTLPIEMWSPILERVAFGQCMENQKPVTLMLVCTEWCNETQRHMEKDKPCWKAWYGVYGHEDIYETFLKGVLIYKPDPHSDEGIIKLKISELPNPLEGTFDLSECGNDVKHLVISTGFRKGSHARKRYKSQVWITPRFLIEKKINTSAQPLQPFMAEWNEDLAPVGVFIEWYGYKENYFDFSTTNDLHFISENNLYNVTRAQLGWLESGSGGSGLCEFSCSFFEPK